MQITEAHFAHTAAHRWTERMIEMEIKPCPMCGKQPVAIHKKNRSFIKCKSCGCLVAADDTLERTAAIWNGYKEQKTYALDFFEKFPNARVFRDGLPDLPACDIYGDLRCFLDNCSNGRDCEICWNEVMPDA